MAARKRPVRGVDLRVKRIRAGVRQDDIASAVGVSRQRISQIEREPLVERTWADRYTEGLKSITP